MTMRVICNECRRRGAPCSWPMGRKKACIGCAACHVTCMVGKESVTHWAPRRVGGLPGKRRKVSRPEILDSPESEEGDSMEWSSVGAGSQLGMSNRDRAAWSLAWEVGRLWELSERTEALLQSLVEDRAEKWKSERRQEKLMQDLIDQVKSGADSLELFAWGDHFLRTREMGKLEGAEVETELRPCRRKLIFEGKGKGKERDQGERPENNLEAEGQHVEMTLQ